MECPKCQSELTVDAFESAHDKGTIEIVLECEGAECDVYLYNFLEIGTFASGND